MSPLEMTGRAYVPVRTGGRFSLDWIDVVRVATYADVVRALDEEPGAWREVVRWPHEEVEQDGWAVPLLAPDPERAAWRRRKWWGRHALEVDGEGRWWRWAGILPMGQPWASLEYQPFVVSWWWPT